MDQVPDTPESQKNFFLKMKKYMGIEKATEEVKAEVNKVQDKVDSLATDLMDHKAFNENRFTRIDERLERQHEESSINKDSIDKLGVTLNNLAIETSSQFDKHEQSIRDLNSRMENHEVLTVQNISDTVKQQVREEMERKVADIEALRKKFSKVNFSDNEQPTDVDLYDMKVAFKKSVNSIGFSPVTKSDLDDIMVANNVGMEDAFRIAAAQYLELEMNFTPEFVRNLEMFLVSYIWDRRNTLYITVSDEVASGLLRVKKEAWILNPGEDERGFSQRQRRELRRLEVPQYRSRYRAMEAYADKQRFTWKNVHPDLYSRGKRKRTRILETDEFDYILQIKEWDEQDYVTHEIPEEVTKYWPKVNFKLKNYIQYDLQYYRPSYRAKTGNREERPKGRTRNEASINPLEPEAAHHVVTLNPSHDFLPGHVRPAQTDPQQPAPLRSLEMASHLTGKTPASMVAELNNGATANPIPNYMRPDAPDKVKQFAAKAAKQEAENKKKEEELKKTEEALKEREARAKQREEEADRIKQSVERERIRLENEKKGKQGEESRSEEAVPMEIPKPLINFFDGSDTEEPVRRMANVRHDSLDPLNDSLGLGSLAGSPSLRTSHNQSQLETQLPPASDLPPEQVTKANAKTPAAEAAKSATFESVRVKLLRGLGKPFGQRLLDEGDQINLAGSPAHANQLPQLRRPEVTHIAGKVRQDGRLIANVDEFDANANPPNFVQYGPEPEPKTTGTKEKTPAKKKQKVTPEKSPSKTSDDIFGSFSFNNSTSVANSSKITEKVNEIPKDSEKEKGSTTLDDREVSLEADDDFKSCHEDDDEEWNDKTLVEDREEKLAGNDTILSPAIIANTKHLDKALNEEDASFIYKAQSTLSSQVICDHSTIEDTLDTVIEAVTSVIPAVTTTTDVASATTTSASTASSTAGPAPTSTSTTSVTSVTTISSSQMPEASFSSILWNSDTKSPPLNVSRPGQASYPSPSVENSSEKKVTPLRQTKITRTEDGRVTSEWKKFFKSPHSQKSTRAYNIKKKVEENRLKAGTPSSIGRYKLNPQQKRNAPESGFQRSSVNKDVRTKSPEQLGVSKKKEIVEELCVSGHQEWPSPPHDATGTITTELCRTPTSAIGSRPLEPVMDELKAFVREVTGEIDEETKKNNDDNKASDDAVNNPKEAANK